MLISPTKTMNKQLCANENALGELQSTTEKYSKEYNKDKQNYKMATVILTYQQLL